MNNKTIVRVVVTAVVLLVFGSVAFASMRNNPMNSTPSSETHSMNSDTNDNKASKTPRVAMDTNQVTYKSFDVVQPSIKVKKGTTVTWTNEDSAKHDVTPEVETDEFKASQLFGKGETYSVTFNTVGKFTYYCSPHPYMKGTVEVTE